MFCFGVMLRVRVRVRVEVHAGGPGVSRGFFGTREVKGVIKGGGG